MEEYTLDLSLKRDANKKAKPAFRFERIADNFPPENQSEIRMADVRSAKVKTSWCDRFHRTNSVGEPLHEKYKIADLFTCGDCGWAFADLGDLLKHITDSHEPTHPKLPRKRSRTDLDNEANEGKHHAKMTKNGFDESDTSYVSGEGDTLVKNVHFESPKQTHRLISEKGSQNIFEKYMNPSAEIIPHPITVMHNCYYCGTIFPERSQLAGHMRIHQFPREMKVLEHELIPNIDISKHPSFNTTSVQKSHLQCHELNYQCISGKKGGVNSKNGLIPIVDISKHPSFKRNSIQQRHVENRKLISRNTYRSGSNNEAIPPAVVAKKIVNYKCFYCRRMSFADKVLFDAHINTCSHLFSMRLC